VSTFWTKSRASSTSTTPSGRQLHHQDLNYTIKPVADGKYGAPVGPNNEWNGMVGELIDKVYTGGVGDLN